tara:strand:+ start:102 stop:668 length:567 start_codon:yes stop_codon:yes gene_type:complete
MLKPVDKKKNPGLAKLPEKVRNKMGYAKKGKIVKAALGAIALGAIGSKGLSKIMKKKASASPTMGSTDKDKAKFGMIPVKQLYQKATEQKKAKAGKMMKAKSGNMAKINKVVKGLNKASKLHQAQAKTLKTIKANVGMAAKKVREDQMMKASMGKSVRGYGAARTSGMGLQDESLPPGKSLDYYKDLM